MGFLDFSPTFDFIFFFFILVLNFCIITCSTDLSATNRTFYKILASIIITEPTQDRISPLFGSTLEVTRSTSLHSAISTILYFRPKSEQCSPVASPR